VKGLLSEDGIKAGYSDLGINAFLDPTHSHSILRHTDILFKRFTPMHRKYLRWMIPGIFRKRFECCYPGFFNISVDRFYFIPNLHDMISLIAVGLNSEALINDNYISDYQIIIRNQ
jgi:hypothetical protein